MFLFLLMFTIVLSATSERIVKSPVVIHHRSRQHDVTTLIAIESNEANKLLQRKHYNRWLPVIIPYLYFMAVNMNLPNLPKWVNSIVNKGSTNVSGSSQKVYGNLSGLDALFTFLSVNIIGCLSDICGRKPFMMYSALGLGISYLLCSTATYETRWIFYLSGCLDGLTSCMFSQAQAYISDISNIFNENLSMSLSHFQGIAIGSAFMLGIPLGGFLGAKFNLKMPLYTAAVFCIACFLSILFLLPESVDLTKKKDISSIQLSSLNPVGAIFTFARSKKLTILGAVYFLLNIAQAGIQIVWINYLQVKFGWPAYISALTLAIVGLTVAIFPRIYLPILGTRNAIQYGLFLHALALILLGYTTNQVLLFLYMPIFALGASTLPTLLGYIAEQAPTDEIGAIQGAAETLRTLATMISFPMASRVFSHYISDGRNSPEIALYFSAIFSFLGFIIFRFSFGLQ